MIFSISWKNVWRSKTRSMVVILAVALGLFGTIFMIALMNGMVNQKVDASISNEISNIQIHNPKFLEDKSIEYIMNDGDQILKEVESTEGVAAACRRIKTTAMVSTANSGNGIMINGIIPEQEKKVTDIYKTIVSGNYFEKTYRSTPTMIISKNLSNKLKADVGSKIVLTIQSTSGEITYGLYRVVGIYKTANSMFDEMNVFVENKSLVSLIGVKPEQASEIAVRLDNNNLTEAMTLELKKKFSSLSVMSWKELDPAVVAIVALLNQFNYFMIAIIMIALTFVIVNAMLMAILERTRELGMLMAIGMNKKKIFLMVMMETIFMSVTGAILGIILSVITIALTQRVGINFAAVAEGMEAMGYSALIYPTVQTAFYVIIGIIVIITATIASIWPARKALKLQPAEAVRSEA